MEILLGVLLGGALGLLLGLLWGRASKEEEIQQALSERAAAQAEARRIPGLEFQIQQLQQENKNLSAQVQSVQTQLSTTTALLDKAEQRFKETFQSLAAEALRVNGEQIVSRTRDILQPLEARLTQLEAERQRGLGELSEKIQSLQSLCQHFQQQAVQLQLETSKLSQALKATGIRAKWAEIQLRRVVELAGMLPYVDFEEQTTLGEGDHRQRPDMLIRLPGGTCIIVDAKAPMQAYLEAIELSDEGKREQKMGEHVTQLRTHIALLASKNYWQQFDLSPQFVVMFLPGESFLLSALEKDGRLLEEAAEKRVVLATPLSLLALLKATAVIWRQEQVNENARRVADIGRELYERLNKWVEHLVKMRDRLSGLVGDFNNAVGSLESRVLVSARRLRDLGVGGDQELPSVSEIQRFPRRVALPEEQEEESFQDNLESSSN